jgi:hypothetical protein
VCAQMTVCNFRGARGHDLRYHGEAGC